MANPIKELRLDIAASIYLCPCTEKELMQRDFLKSKSIVGTQRIIMQLEKDALFYRDGKMNINIAWAKKNLKEYQLDFRSERQKYIDSLTPFARKVYGL